MNVDLKLYYFNMNYNLTLFLAVDESMTKVELTVLDRDRNIVPVKKVNQSGLLVVSMEVPMPNRLFVMITGKEQQNQNTFIEVKGMSLGGVRFNNSQLDNLFEFKPDDRQQAQTLDDYLLLESVKTKVWDCNGCVILELFDTDPIRYHLHLKTVGLSAF